MPGYLEDSWIHEHARTHSLSELEDCSIAVEASYYLNLFLTQQPSHEPLLAALGGLTGLESHIQRDLDQWKAHRITPFFIFDGQPVTGQDEVASEHGIETHTKTVIAWQQYSKREAGQAVTTFGAIRGVWPPQTLYPPLKRFLRARGLHFISPPYKAAGQIAYFDMIDSDQCAAIMGSQELLMYPIRDLIIQSINWSAKTVTSISKKTILRALNSTEPMFIDALLMSGTTFTLPFPPLQDTTMYGQSFHVNDAVNILRTSDKTVENACASFNDMLQIKDPNWLDKYQKARMAIHHFIYVAEDGEIIVNDYDRLTKDNHLYLGLQLPAELFYYLSTGLIGHRILSYITHGQILIPPTLDGFLSDEYRSLVTKQIPLIEEDAVCLMIPRLHRGIQHKDIQFKTWFDPKFVHTISYRSVQAPASPAQRAATWDVKEADYAAVVESIGEGFQIQFEVAALLTNPFTENSVATGKLTRGIESASLIKSIVIWRFLHLRGYVKDNHRLTDWGTALAVSLVAMKEYHEQIITKKKKTAVPDLHLEEAVLIAFELIRFDLLNGKNHHPELGGLPMTPIEEERISSLLISRCATLLKLQHKSHGYTGPLNLNLLTFRSLSATVRDADRDLVEAILASMFMYGQAKRERDDGIDIYLGLPFLYSPDIGMGIATKTFLDDVKPDQTPEERAAHRADFAVRFIPNATNFEEDLDTCWAFFDALVAGVGAVRDNDMSAADKAVWKKAAEYLQPRR